ncbi:MAG: Dabb family protein [Saprospiraceae bacterium]|nr:Dabb family protein [Saprospiraceae bacterium]
MKNWLKSLLIIGLPVLIGMTYTLENSEMDQVLKHTVLFKFKDASSIADVDMICQAFANLPKEIKEIKSFEWGENNSPEGLNQGLTHCFVMSFKSEADRDAYLIHPAHKAFGGKLGPHLDKVTVVDYWVK